MFASVRGEIICENRIEKINEMIPDETDDVNQCVVARISFNLNSYQSIPTQFASGVQTFTCHSR